MLNKQKMFSELAKDYDFFNNIISLGTHKLVKQIDIREDIINIQDGGCDVIRLSVDLETEGIVIKINGVA